MTGTWNQAGAVLPAQTSARSATQLSAAPSAGDVGLGAQVLFFDPSATRRVYYTTSPDGQQYVAVGSLDNPRGRNILPLGGSETARGNCIIPCDPGTVTGDGSTLFATTKVPHLLHSGATVTLSSEAAVAPELNGGSVTFENTFAYGAITVTSGVTFTMPYSGPAGTSGYQFVVCCLQLLSPNGKLTELNRRLGGVLEQVANFGTGSNNTANMLGRVPMIVSLIHAGVIAEVRGSFAIGNTAIWGANHQWTPQQIRDRVVLDVGFMVRAFAAAGASSVIDLPAVQLNTTAADTTGLRLIYEAMRQLAADPANRLRTTDDFALFVDPATGQGRQRYYRGNDGSDPTHPSNEGCVMCSYSHLDGEREAYPLCAERLMRSALDTRRADPLSLQLMDGFLAGDNTVDASTLDGHCTGLVPASIFAIQTSGGGGRGIQFSYVLRSDRRGYDVYGQITAAAAGDSFAILINNPGARDLKFSMVPGARYYAGLDCACVPLTGQVASVDTYMGLTASYGAVSSHKGYLTSDSLNATLYPDGVLTQPRRQGDCMPEFVAPQGITAVQGIALQVVVTAASAGTSYVRFGLPTVRQIS